jgi:hypothetical protein
MRRLQLRIYSSLVRVPNHLPMYNTTVQNEVPDLVAGTISPNPMVT